VTEENYEVPESTPPPEPEERRSWFRHTSRRILDRDTRSGRLIHTALIHIIVSGVAFAIGMLVMYLWLYRPVANQLTTAQGERAAITTELEQAQAAHEQTRAELQAAEDQIQSLEQTVESQEHQLERTAARIHLLRVMYHSRVAQSALQNRDQTTARRAIGEARRELDAALPADRSRGRRGGAVAHPAPGSGQQWHDARPNHRPLRPGDPHQQPHPARAPAGQR
jgi:F0F1-type ATP synthase membrane subunit b/b'